ncbi:FAD-dependent oxidoreductase [soil metagenome]
MKSARPFSLPLWSSASDVESFGALHGDCETDVVVIGAGMTGITAANRLVADGKRVIVVERDAVASGETGQTTAHLTEVTDTRYRAMVSDFGAEVATGVARASREAIAQIEAIARTIPCDFERLPAYLFCYSEKEVEPLQRELVSMTDAGLAATMVSRVPFPFAVQMGIRIDRQAQFQPRAYVRGLAGRVRAAGAVISEGTTVLSIEDADPCRVVTDRGTILCRDVVIAAHGVGAKSAAPATKLRASRTYVVAGRVATPPPYGLFWDTLEPYHYVRTVQTDRGRLLVIGGEDHRLGDGTESEERFGALAHYARSHFGMSSPEYRWSGQVTTSVDGLPMIGRTSGSEHVYVAAAFGGNGMTFGVIAGNVLADAIAGRENRDASIFSPTRCTLGGAPRLVGRSDDVRRSFAG